MARRKTQNQSADSRPAFTPIEVSVPTLTSPVATSEVTAVQTVTGDVAAQPSQED